MTKKLICLILLLAALGMSLAAAEPTSACSCTRAPSPGSLLDGSDAVFTGRIISVTQKEAKGIEGYNITASIAKFEVLNLWKGPSQAQIEIDGGSIYECGLPFKEGQEWLIYAYKDQNDELATGLCSASKDLASAEADIKTFGKPAITFSPTDVSAPEESSPVVSIVLGIFAIALIAGLGISIYKSGKKP